jgi:DivIVA domain-containing protein
MALDRHSVMRTDFPMSRRGYDRIAVDRHLDEIAREMESLQRPSVGAQTSMQVQSILDAAEASAAEIERRAWDDASRVQEATDHALARARAQVEALGMASRSLRDRLEGLLAEVESIEGTLDEMGAEPVQMTFDPQDTMAFDPILEEDVAEAALTESPGPVAIEPPPTELHAVVDQEPVAPEPVAPEPVAPEPEISEPEIPGPREARFGRNGRDDSRTGWFQQGPPAWTGAAVAHSAATVQARESARLVALNMADGGQPREAADAYLAELFAPAERAALLDEIYGGR